MLDAVAIGAHPDDVEIGMGGTLLALGAEGLRVGILDLTDGEPTPTGSVEKRAAEASEAARLLGVSWRRTLEFPNRYLVDTIPNRKRLAAVLREVRPRLMFVPYWVDAHPDHEAACKLCEAAAFYCKLTRSDIPGDPFPPPRLLYYFCNHLRLHAEPSLVLDVTPHLEAKLQAVRAYASQFNPERGNLEVFERVRQHAAYWGSLIRRPAAEIFFTREPLGLSSLSALTLW